MYNDFVISNKIIPCILAFLISSRNARAVSVKKAQSLKIESRIKVENNKFLQNTYM